MQRQWRTKTRNENEIENKPSKLGQVVSVDQLVSPTPGLIAQMMGFIAKQCYSYATEYVDQASSHGYVHLQRSASAEETLEGKAAYEMYAQIRGVEVRAYHADNGIFKARKWVEDCQQNDQSLTFAGVGAHHSNGKAERRIRELQELAQTQLLHASKRWPNAISAHLWPYALRHANDCYNAAPNMQHNRKLSLYQIFARTLVNINKKHWKPFGCPVYVLNEHLQTNQHYHKWKERARVRIYLGQSPIHNRNVALVLNRTMGYVSLQFHVKFDNGFHTMKQENLTSTWQQATYFTKKSPRDHQHSGIVKNKKRKTAEPNNNSNQPEISTDLQTTRETDQNNQCIESPTNEAEKDDHHQQQQQQVQRELDRDPQPTPLQRSTRVRKKPQRLIDMMAVKIQQNNNDIPAELLAASTLFPMDDTHNSPYDPLLIYKAADWDPDTMYHHQAMKQPDRNEFIRAMQKEVDDQMAEGNFSIVRRSGLPKGTKVFPSVWQMRQKRDIKTQEVKKWKARLNFDGSKMEQGVHYDQSYPPVATWGSIRLVLVMAAARKWVSTQVDYIQAFPQAPTEREVFMSIPRGKWGVNARLRFETTRELVRSETSCSGMVQVPDQAPGGMHRIHEITSG